MILHPAISDIASRAVSVSDAVRKGYLSPELGRYASPGWAYLFKDGPSPALAFSKAGNSLDSLSSEADGAIAYVVTTDEEDRDGDIVRPMGVQLANYGRNPIVFFGHQEWEIPIGVCRSPDGRITVYPEENRVVDVVYFDREDPDADFVYSKCLRKILNATSIAFVPIEAWKRDEYQKARTHSQPTMPLGWYFNQWDKTEVSIVGVPSNPGAVGLEKDLQSACRDCWDRERSFMSPKLRKAWQPYCAVAKGRCWSGWCPPPVKEVAMTAKKRKADDYRLEERSDGTWVILDRTGRTVEVRGHDSWRLESEAASALDYLETGRYGRFEKADEITDEYEVWGVKDGKKDIVWHGEGKSRAQAFADSVKDKYDSVMLVRRKQVGRCEKGDYSYKGHTIRTSRVSSGWHWKVDGVGESSFPVSTEDEAVAAAQAAVDRKKLKQSSANVDPDKACQILRDGEIDGKVLTDDQRGMFGAACARAKKSWGGLRETCKALTQADLDSPGVPGRESNPPGDAEQEKADGVDVVTLEPYNGKVAVYKLNPDGSKQMYPWIVRPTREEAIEQLRKVTGGNFEVKSMRKALGESEGRIGGYAVSSQQMDATVPESWATCEACHGDGNCVACGGTGTNVDKDCIDCDGSGECSICDGEGYVKKFLRKQNSAGHTPPQIAPQVEDVVKQPTVPQVLAALYSHAKAEAAYLDQLDDTYKDSLADYRRQQVEERMDMLKYQFSRVAGDGDDIEKLCKDFEDEHDKGLESTGPDSVVEPGEAGLVEQGQVPPEPEEEAKEEPGTEEWVEEEATEPEHKQDAVEDDPETVPKDDFSQSSDPSADEILERYRNPKTNRWVTRKWIVARHLLPFLKYRVAADGKKYLIRGAGDSEIKSLTTKLASAVSDLKAFVRAPDMPKHHRVGLKHVADQIWYVGKALTDKGKEQRDGGKGGELDDKGKEQRDGGKGSQLKGVSRQVSPAVERRLNDLTLYLQRQGIINEDKK